MENKFRHIQLETLSRHLADVRVCDRPQEGWVCAVRKALHMSLRQLAGRIGTTQQSASRLEKNEANCSITLKSLRKAAEAMDCKLVYALVPNDGNLEDIIRKQALKKAKEIVDPVDHSMMLEEQNVGYRQDQIQRLADELARDLSHKLWD